MNRHFFTAAFVLGALAVTWVATGFIAANPLALVMTVLIGGAYALGAWELLQFRRATDTLVSALNSIAGEVADLGQWLAGLPAPLHNPVRLRIEGERIGLPGPAMTPYLVGLLVMLGMLGTFLGMVVTFKGAVFALEGTTDLLAMRTALAAPIKGLGLAFGTSVAGVAASAMLGLMSALVRRERLQAGQLLDSQISTNLRCFSLTHQRQETFKALQLQSQALPAMAAQLQTLMAAMEQHSQQLNGRLLSNQDQFHGHIQGVYTDLARSVDQSLQTSLTRSAQVAFDAIKPVANATLSGMAEQASQIHAQLLNTTQTQLDAFSSRFEARSTALVATLGDAFAGVQASQAQGNQQQLAGWTQSLDTIATTLQREWQVAGAQTLVQQQQICTTLEQTASQITTQAQSDTRATLAEIKRVLDTAAEAPRAAAQVISELRQELSSSMVRDNAVLAERSRMMETLNTLLDATNVASTDQRAAIDSLLASSGELLNRVGSQFVQQVQAESDRLSDTAAQVSSSAVEVASLGESFGVAVQRFTDTNTQLMASLQRIESALDKSMARSDDQLGYYVAQAREIIDLSIMSQKEVLDDLRHLRSQQAATVAEVN
jgi:hypothetical protein